MKHLKLIVGIMAVLSFSLYSFGQIRITSDGTGTEVINNSSAAINISELPTGGGALSNVLNKGIVYPRTDLTQFSTFVSPVPTGIPGSFPTNFDGTVVYNTGEGIAALGDDGEGNDLIVSRGFYYYSNPTPGVNQFNAGRWIRMSEQPDMEELKNLEPWRDADSLTAATNASGDIVYQNGNVGIGPIKNPTAQLHVDGTLKFENTGQTQMGTRLLIDENGSGDYKSINLDDLRNLLNISSFNSNLVTLGTAKIRTEDINGTSSQYHYLGATDLFNMNSTTTLNSDRITNANFYINFSEALPYNDYIVVATVESPGDAWTASWYHLTTLVTNKTTTGFNLSLLEREGGTRPHEVNLIIYRENSDLNLPDTQTRQSSDVDWQWHNVQLDNTYAVTKVFGYVGHYWENIGLTGTNLADDGFLSPTNTSTWYGPYGVSAPGTSQNTYHQHGGDHTTQYAFCPNNSIVTGIEAYSSHHLDGALKIKCTQLNAGYSTESGQGTVDAQGPPNSGYFVHSATCPANQYVKGVSIYATGHFDYDLKLYCTPIF